MKRSSFRMDRLERRTLLATMPPLFDAQRYHFDGAYPQSVATGDFNEDGFADIATTYLNSTSSAGGVRILLNNGAGGFSEGAVIPTRYPRRTFEAADFDSDGHLDLLTQEESPTTSGSPYNTLLWGRGDGTFESGVDVFGNRGGSIFDLGDFNGDGRTDVVLSSRGTASTPLAIVYGNGSRTLATPVTIASPSSGSTAAVGDFNGDSRDDIAVAATTYLNDGAGGFTTVANSNLSSPSVYYAVADLNGDHRDDVVKTGSFNDFFPSTIDISVSNGDGTFTNSSVPGTTVYHDVAVADVDGDGKPDIVAAAHYGQHFAISKGVGDGTFSAPQPFGNGDYTSWTVAVDDFNNDGRNDLTFAHATQRESAGSVSVVLNLPSSGLGYAQSFSGNMARQTLNADFNEDGLQDLIFIARTGSQVGVQLSTSAGVFGAISYIPFASTPASIALGDFNGDGNVDFAATGTGYSSVHLGNGAGVFTAVQISATSGTRIAVGDFNDDGVDDAAFLDSSVLIAAHLGGNAFGNTTLTYTGTAATRIAAGDFNGDGKDDLILGGGEIIYRLLRRTGANVFAAPVSQTLTGWELGEYVVEDVNFDGRADLLLSVRTAGGTPVTRIRIHTGQANGTLPGTSEFNVANTVFTTGDFDGDGRVDIAYPYTITPTNGAMSTGRVAILRGRDDGTFTPLESFALNDVAGFIHAGDLNQDGRLDLVLTSTSLFIPGQQPRAESLVFNRRGPDTTPLTVVSATLDVETAQRVVFVLDGPVDASSVSVADLVATHGSSGQTFTASAVAITHNGTRVTFTFDALPDGLYTFALGAGAFQDLAGNASLASTLAGPSIFILAADVTRDKLVNFDDLLLIAKNYGSSGKSFSQGNIDYSADGLVGFSDLLLLAQRYGATLLSASPVSAATKRRRGVEASILA